MIVIGATAGGGMSFSSALSLSFLRDSLSFDLLTLSSFLTTSGGNEGNLILKFSGVTVGSKTHFCFFAELLKISLIFRLEGGFSGGPISVLAVGGGGKGTMGFVGTGEKVKVKGSILLMSFFGGDGGRSFLGVRANDFKNCDWGSSGMAGGDGVRGYFDDLGDFGDFGDLGSFGDFGDLGDFGDFDDFELPGLIRPALIVNGGTVSGEERRCFRNSLNDLALLMLLSFLFFTFHSFSGFTGLTISFRLGSDILMMVTLFCFDRSIFSLIFSTFRSSFSGGELSLCLCDLLRLLISLLGEHSDFDCLLGLLTRVIFSLLVFCDSLSGEGSLTGI